jgi:hypothetical protein
MNDTRVDLQFSRVDGKPDARRLTAAQGPRLVVVLQDVQQEAPLAGRILELARSRGLGILLVGLVHEPENEPELRRQLVRIAAFIGNARRRDEALPVEIHIQRGMGWLDSLRCLLRPGDQLACCADWNTGGLRRPLNDVLGGALMQPVYVFADLRPERVDRRTRITSLLGWLLSLGSVVVFCLVATRIVLETYGWLQPVLLLGGLLLEVGFIYFVNSFVGWF